MVTANRCAVRDPLAYRQVAIEEEINRKGTKQDGSLVTIPVYWHVITPAAGGADISSLIPAQMQVLNDAFSASGFAFQVERVRVTVNDDWFFATVGSAEEAQMKATLRAGGPDSLNIYTTNADVYLGWATFGGVHVGSIEADAQAMARVPRQESQELSSWDLQASKRLQVLITRNPKAVDRPSELVAQAEAESARRRD